MKYSPTRHAVVALMLVLFAGAFATAADLPADDAKLIEAAKVPIFNGAVFVNGNQDVGFRFATGVAPEEVRAWYKEKLGEWSLYEEYGGWILYEGAPGAGMGDLMTKKQVAVQKNDKLGEWYGLDPALSTEIVIMIPKQ